jgi:hypothetical protein
MKNDWETILFNYFKKVQDQGFAWGKWDCVRFVNGYIEAVTDQTAIPKGISWSDEKSALEAISELGDNFPQTINNVLNKLKYKQIKLPYITVGDIVLFKEKEHLLGIFDGTHIQAISDSGLIPKPVHLAKQIWRING